MDTIESIKCAFDHSETWVKQVEPDKMPQLKRVEAIQEDRKMTDDERGKVWYSDG